MSGNCLVYSDLSSQFMDLGEEQRHVSFYSAILDQRHTLEARRNGRGTTVVANPWELLSIGLIKF